jgi:hypothetical protein
LETIVADADSRSERSEKREGRRSERSDRRNERREIKTHEATSLAKEAFEFGATLLLTSIQADYLSQVTEPTGLRAPVNQFGHGRAFVDASDRTVVGFNVDNLYSFAVVDVSDEPIVMSVPEMGDRYWIMQVIDAWNGVPGAPGSRSHGGQGGVFLLTSPSYSGDVPDGMEEIRCPTAVTMIGGRTYCSGPDDYAAVNALQDECRLTPLSEWKQGLLSRLGEGYEPPSHVPLRAGVDGETLVTDQFMGLAAGQFYRKLNELLVGNPASAPDAPLLERLKTIGIGPGLDFELSSFPTRVEKAIELGYQLGRVEVMKAAESLGESVNGWSLTYDMGRFGTKYAYRSAWTLVGIGGNLMEDAFYPTTTFDGDGDDLSGADRYELTFAASEIPPASAFWSLTMYDDEAYLVPNELDRYAVGDRTSFDYAPDGSLTIYMQHENPGPDKEANWLPAPEGEFRLALRLYVPDKRVVDRSWVPSPVQKVTG